MYPVQTIQQISQPKAQRPQNLGRGDSMGHHSWLKRDPLGLSGNSLQLLPKVLLRLKQRLVVHRSCFRYLSIAALRPPELSFIDVQSYSSLPKLLRVTALCLKFLQCVLWKPLSERMQSKFLQWCPLLPIVS